MARLNSTSISGDLHVSGVIYGNAEVTGTTENANKASRLDLSNQQIGNSTKPVYFSSEGLPVACGESLSVNITGNAATSTKVSNLFIIKSFDESVVLSFNGETKVEESITPSFVGAWPLNEDVTYDRQLVLTYGTENTTYVSLKANGRIQASAFNATSDARLKENFKEFKSEKSILDLPIYRFNFKKDNVEYIGCKAQDLQEICPEIVSEGEDGYLSIQESKIVYLLIEEIKKLKEEIERLK